VTADVVVEPNPAIAINKVAALDLGSNSFHLVVARIVAQDVQILHRLKFRVQLADGLDDDDRLSDKAIERGLDNLRLMAESLNDFHPDQVRIVATYTLRKARNAKKFVKAARKILPYPIEIISGLEEARLIYSGVAHTNYHEGNRLAIDIGGGSTELIIGEGYEPLLMRSLPLGCVTLGQRYFKGGRIREKDFTKAIRRAHQEIDSVSTVYRREGWDSCVGSSGTVKAIVEFAHALGTESRENHITLDDLKRLTKICVEAGHVDELNFPGITPERQHVFPSGLAILIAVFEGLGIEALEYSQGALREGVLYEMEERMEEKDIRERTAQSLVTRYVVDVEQAHRVRETTLNLYRQVKKKWQIDSPELQNLLTWAALLHEVGLHIHSRNVHRHSEYILRNVELPGFNIEEQKLLATLARFQRKKIQKDEFREFLLYAPPEVSRLIALLRLGVLLNFKRQDDILPDLIARVKKNEINLDFGEGWLEERPVFTANLERENHQISALGITLSVK